MDGPIVPSAVSGWTFPRLTSEASALLPGAVLWLAVQRRRRMISPLYQNHSTSFVLFRTHQKFCFNEPSDDRKHNEYKDMEKVVFYLLPAILGFIGGYFLCYRNHRLTVHRDSANRRREFRAAIRQIIGRFDNVHSMSFFTTYQASVPEVKKLCIDILDDIGKSSVPEFTKCRELYCSYKQSDLELIGIRPTPDGLEEHMKANIKKQAESKGLLCATLEKIAVFAR
jgi:hypothetical protein